MIRWYSVRVILSQKPQYQPAPTAAMLNGSIGSSDLLRRDSDNIWPEGT